MRAQKGLTLLEIVFTLTLLVFLVSSVVLVTVVVLRGWDHTGHRIDLHEKLHFTLERMMRETREATAIYVANHGLRFTLRESGSENGYIYYLYHASDAWPPAYNQTVYDLYREALTEAGAADDLSDDTFTYGSGDLITTSLTPPTGGTNITASGNLITILLEGKDEDDTLSVRRKLKARNL